MGTRDGEMTIKIKFSLLRGGGLGGREENRPKTLVFVGNAATIFGIIERGGTASLRSRTCIKRNGAFGARFKGLSLYFLYQNGKLIRIKTGLDTCLIRIRTRTPPVTVPPL